MQTAADSVVEYQAVYDGAVTSDPNYQGIKKKIPPGTEGTIEFDIKKKMPRPVYVYYELDNFYQNHRRYVKSRNDAQLRNALGVSDATLKTVKSAEDAYGGDATIKAWADKFNRCEPMILPAGVPTTCKYGTNATNGKPCKILWPCGLIASSFFNDVFVSNTSGVTWRETGISWQSDREKKFKNPDGWDDASFKKDDDSVYMYLHQRYKKFDELTGGKLRKEGVKNEHFIVWMRTAGLPTFRKLYAVIDKDLDVGKFTIKVHSQFEVAAFNGNKKLIISTVSWLGGRNYFLGVAYLVVGSISVMLALFFFAKHKMNPRKLGDSQYLVWSDKKES